MRFSILAATLLFNGLALTNPLLARQETTTMSSVSSSTSSSSTSTSSVPTTTATTTANTATGSTSTSSSSTSNTSSTVPTASSLPSGLATCTQGDADSIYTANNYTGTRALCGFSSGNNTIVVSDVSSTLYITWWAGAFTDPQAQVTIHLDWTDKSGKVQWNSTTPAYMGFVAIQIVPSLLNGASSSRYQLVLDERDATTGGATTRGPIVTFVQQSNTPAAPPPTSFNFLGVVIGVPVAVAVIAAVLAIFCCVTNRHKSFFAKIKLPTRRRGYGVRQSRRQRIGNPTDDFDFDASAPIYRDEPGAEYAASTRDERSAHAMGVFSAERKLHSTY